MIKNLKQSIILTVMTVIMFGFAYPLMIFVIAQIMPDKSIGSPVIVNEKVVGFENIGQSFTDDKYYSYLPKSMLAFFNQPHTPGTMSFQTLTQYSPSPLGEGVGG